MRADARRNRDRILEVARELIARDGPGTSMDAIAAAAGVAVGTLYRHHPTKAALVGAVIERSIEQIAEAIEAAGARVDAGADAGQQVAGLFREIAGRHALDDAVKQAAASLGDGVRREGAADARAWRALEHLLERARRAGGLRPDVGSADLVALLAGVPGSDTPVEVRDRYVDVVLRGLRP